MNDQATDPAARWPVSVKGVVINADRVLLARNDRGEWELPGGRLELGETPAECVAREIDEECGLQVAARRLLDCWVFEVIPGRRVLIVAYGCDLLSQPSRLRVSGEHDAVAFLPLTDLGRIALPEGYRSAIRRALEPPAID